MVRLGRLAHKSRSEGSDGGVEIEMVPVTRSSADSARAPPPPPPSATAASNTASSQTSKSTSLLSRDDMCKILDMLAQKKVGILSSSKCQELTALVNRNDESVLAIFGRYEMHKNVQVLAEELRGFEIDEAEDGESEEDESDEDESEEEQEEDFGVRFNNIVKSMGLAELDTAALRLAIQRNDPDIKAALGR